MSDFIKWAKELTRAKPASLGDSQMRLVDVWLNESQNMEGKLLTAFRIGVQEGLRQAKAATKLEGK